MLFAESVATLVVGGTLYHQTSFPASVVRLVPLRRAPPIHHLLPAQRMYGAPIRNHLQSKTSTIGIECFVECLKHLAKCLPSVTLDKERSVNSTSATASLPSTFYRALSRVSLGTWQRKVAVTAPGNGDGAFAECHLILSTKRLPLCQVSTGLLGKGPPAGPFVSFFAEFARRHSAKLASLPSARVTALSKEALLVPRCSLSAERYDTDTRQITSLLSVTLSKVTSTHLFNLFFLFHTNKQKISHIHHRYHIIITDIIYTSHIVRELGSHLLPNCFWWLNCPTQIIGLTSLL
jgi:hypothetical protein